MCNLVCNSLRVSAAARMIGIPCRWVPQWQNAQHWQCIATDPIVIFKATASLSCPGSDFYRPADVHVNQCLRALEESVFTFYDVLLLFCVREMVRSTVLRGGSPRGPKGGIGGSNA